VTENTIREAIDARLTDDEKWTKQDGIRRVHHVTWGRHTASNDYKHVRHTMLMGLNFLPRATNHAEAGAACNVDLLTEHPTETQIEAQRTGMLMDATLQAILRGHAWMGADGDCGVCEVVIPQTRQTGLSDAAYQTMFPEVRLEADTLLMPARPLKGRLRDLDAIVVRRLGAGEREMTNVSLYGEMGMMERNFRALVQKPEWQSRRAQLGLNPQLLIGRTMGMRLVP
jgi:hypothetical protein